ncbi:hypothetical protein ACXYMU_06155 [Pontibacter sp. CAU 1760]
MNEKLSENPSFKKFEKQLQGFELLSTVLPLLSGFGFSDESLISETNKIPELRLAFNELSNLPEKFNNLLSARGWIAYESMNFEVIRETVDIAELGELDKAEQKLVEYYNPDNIYWKITALQGIKEFKPRMELLEKAFLDYKERRYYACIPIVLMMIDGFVNDIEQKGFFAEGTDLSALDSIAAHSSGLNILAKVFGQTRKKTNSEPLTIPFRNGILHGRDLNYDSDLVAAKTWSVLFCVADWARAIRNGKKIPIPEEPPKELKEQLLDFAEILKEFKEQQFQNKKHKELFEEWKPRKLIIGTDIASNGNIDDFLDNTPERELVIFLENWQNSKYGIIAGRIWDFHSIPETISKKAGRIRSALENIELQSFKIIYIDDQAPAITEIKVELYLKSAGHEYRKEKVFRFIYEGNDRSPLIRSDKSGSWKIIDSFWDLSANS